MQIWSHMVQFKGNLTHAGNSHVLFMHVAAHAHVCACTVYAHGKNYRRVWCTGIHARQRITVTGNHTASSHHPQFFMLVYLLSTHRGVQQDSKSRRWLPRFWNLES